MAVFIFTEPFNYGGFTEYLFNRCPNLKTFKWNNTVASDSKPFRTAIKIELNVDDDIAYRIIDTMKDLNFIDKSNSGGNPVIVYRQ